MNEDGLSTSAREDQGYGQAPLLDARTIARKQESCSQCGHVGLVSGACPRCGYGVRSVASGARKKSGRRRR